MTIPDTIIYSTCASIVSAPLIWIGRSLSRIVREVKTVSMIVRTCPGCQPTVDQIDKANEHSI